MALKKWLDGLRGFAALIVVFGHCSSSGIDIIPLLDASKIAKSGVWLFFVLSAYLLARPLADDIAANGWRAVVRFGVRRLFRILPLYYAFLGGLVFYGAMNPDDAWRHVLFLEGHNHLWTMPAEMLFYAVLPIFAVVASRTAAFFLLALSAVLYVLEPSAIGLNSIFLPNYLIFFALGIVVAYLRPSPRGLAWGAAGLIVMAFSTPRALLLTGISLKDSLRFAAFGGIGAAMILFGGISSPKFRRPFECSPLAYIGQISFGLYLVHFQIMATILATPLPTWTKGPAVLLLSIAVATIAHFAIERPMNRAGHKIAAMQRLSDPARGDVTVSG